MGSQLALVMSAAFLVNSASATDAKPFKPEDCRNPHPGMKKHGTTEQIDNAVVPRRDHKGVEVWCGSCVQPAISLGFRDVAVATYKKKKRTGRLNLSLITQSYGENKPLWAEEAAKDLLEKVEKHYDLVVRE